MSALAPLLQGVFVPPTVQQPQAARPTGQASKPVPSVDNFDRIVDDYQRRLYGFALRMTGNREDAEEIVQDAFVRAYRALGKMSARAAARAAPATVALHDHAERHAEPLAQQAAGQRRARRAGRPRRSLARDRTKARRVRKRSSSKTPTWRWSKTRCYNFRCIFAPQRRCVSSKAAAIRKSPKSSTNRSARSSRTCIAPCASCAEFSVRKSDESPPKETPFMRCREVEALWDEIRGDCAALASRTPSRRIYAPVRRAKSSTNSTKASLTASRASRNPIRRAICEERRRAHRRRSRHKERADADRAHVGRNPDRPSLRRLQRKPHRLHRHRYR